MKLSRVIWLLLIALLLFGCTFESETPAPAAPTRAPAAPTIAFTPESLPAIVTVAPPPPPTAAPLPTAPPAGATSAPQAGVSTEMVDVPAGAFQMGSNSGPADAKPQHEATLPAFRIDKFEVTNVDFQKFVSAASYKTDPEKAGDSDTWQTYAKGKDTHPVVKVSWNDADAFCKWAGKRLPTEQEWEKAARGTDGRAFPWGNDFDPKKANTKEGGIRATTVVGSFGAGASPVGALDMAGNVAEWTASEPAVYPGGARTGRLFSPGARIIRGGGWFDTKEFVGVSVRNSGVPIAGNDDLGFRCAK